MLNNARLSWRWSPRLRRTRLTWPELAGMGAAPASIANASAASGHAAKAVPAVSPFSTQPVRWCGLPIKVALIDRVPRHAPLVVLGTIHHP